MHEQKIELERLQALQAKLQADYYANADQERAATEYSTKTELYTARRKISVELKLIEPLIVQQTNVVNALQNGGELLTISDKIGNSYANTPSFTKIPANLISFNEETILTEPLPGYIPVINEENFKQKGFVFDCIRINNDQYLLAPVKFYTDKEKTQISNYMVDVNDQPKFDNFFVLLTLDQLVLTNEYYYVKAKAKLQKDADDRNARNEAHYDNLPLERREKHFNQPGYYKGLPSAVKKKVTESQWNAFTLPEKESYYKPFKKPGTKRLNAVLDDHHMWASYHALYETFLNPKAVHPAPKIANPEVWEYWTNFRDMMKWKIKDLREQRKEQSETYKAALETSFGESNTDFELKEQYGILVKSQDGSKIEPEQIEQIKQAWILTNTILGNLRSVAADAALKITHTGNKLVFASKAAGVYVGSMGTIAVSNKFGPEQFNAILAHELGHFIDHKIGLLKNKRHATDDYESTAGKLAFAFRKNMNQASDSDYINATNECFARAIEQYFAIEQYGIDATLIYTSNQTLPEFKKYITEAHYVSITAYNTIIKPLVMLFLHENKDFFSTLPVTEIAIQDAEKYMLPNIPTKLKEVLETNQNIKNDIKMKTSKTVIADFNIIEGARFKIPDGTIWIIDEVKKDDDGDMMVRTSIEGGQKGNYKDTIEEVVAFFNEENVEMLPAETKTENIDAVNIAALEEYNSRTAHLDHWLKSDNKHVINSSVHNLMEWVEKHPSLYPQFVTKMYQIPKAFRQGVNPYDLDFGLPAVVEWLNQQNINLFELLPVKEYNLPKYKPFDTRNDDKVFMDIHADFSGEDTLRPKMLGSNFNDHGVVTTNAHLLLFTQYRGSHNNKYGNFCHTKKCFSHEEDVQKSGFMDWQRVIPENNPYKLHINAKAVLDFIKNSIDLQVINPITKAIAFYYPDKNEDGTISLIGFNAEFLKECIEGMIKLGHKELEVGFSSPNRACLIYPLGQSGNIKDLKTDFALCMPVMLESSGSKKYTANVNYNFETNYCNFVGNNKLFCFDVDVKKEEKQKEIIEKIVNHLEISAKNDADVEPEFKIGDTVYITDKTIKRYGHPIILKSKNTRTGGYKAFDTIDKVEISVSTNSISKNNVKQSSETEFNTTEAREAIELLTELLPDLNKKDKKEATEAIELLTEMIQNF